jgi:predicted alpha/beta hydrolase family esterase
MKIKNVLWIHWRWSNISKSETSWYDRKKDLENRWLSIEVPQFDDSEDPSYKSWTKTLDDLNINEYDAILTSSHWWWVIIKYLLDKNIKLKRLVMVCPWRAWIKRINTWKLYKYLDENNINLTNLVKEVIVVNSKDDECVPYKNWENIARKIWAKFILLDWYWHKMQWKSISIVNDLVINWLK